METEILLPQVGESVTEGTISKWLVDIGTKVEKFDPLVEVVTDKVTLEVPSPISGTITAIVARIGQILPMGSVIARIDSTGPLPLELSSVDQIEVLDRTGILLKDARPVGPTGSGDQKGIEPDILINQHEIKSDPVLMEAPTLEKRSIYSPVVRRMAEESGIDLSRIDGTGINGRVTKKDVNSFLQKNLKMPIGQNGESDLVQAARETNEPLTPIRRIIAQNMEISARTIPQAWSMIEVDITDLVSFRDSIKDKFFHQEGIRLTYLPFITKTLVRALLEFPLLNSSWGEDRIILKNSVHLGIATDTPLGLMVPVLHRPEEFGIVKIAHLIYDIVERARNNQLTLDDVQGGTFTLNNTGVLGSVISQPLINPPQAAILTTESIVKRATVMPYDGIAIRSIMNLCISFDHRILDGGKVGAFLKLIKEQLETVSEETRNHLE